MDAEERLGLGRMAQGCMQIHATARRMTTVRAKLQSPLSQVNNHPPSRFLNGHIQVTEYWQHETGFECR